MPYKNPLTDIQKQKRTQRHARWRARHLEAHAANSAKWCAAHPEQVKAMGRRYYKQNRESCAARNRNYYAKHPRECREQMRKWHDEHRAEARESKRKWVAAHREHVRAQQHQHYLEHRAERLESARQWRADHPEANAVNHRKRKALVCGAVGSHTSADIATLFETQAGKCVACTVPLFKSGKGKYHVDHIRPLSRGGSNNSDNLQLLCPFCNISKKDKLPEEWTPRRPQNQ